MHIILVPLDGSRLARRVLPHVRAMAGSFRARLHLLGVVETDRLDLHFYYQHYALAITEGMQFTVTRALDRDRKALEQQGFMVTSQVVTGRPAETILQVAREQNADLIALSTHGRAGLGRWALGSVAHDLVANSPVPLLVYHPGRSKAKELTYQRLLLPLDGSALGETAIPLAQSLALGLRARLLLVQVVPTTLDYVLGPHWTVIPQDLEEQAVAVAQLYLNEVAGRLSQAGVEAETAVLRGEPARAILGLVEERRADLIVMTTHGHSGPAHLLLGSMADRVVREASRPVLLIRPSPRPASAQSVP